MTTHMKEGDVKKIYSYRRLKPAEPLPNADGNTLQKILSNSAVIVTIVTALLYFHGRSLYQGYLSYWGLNTDLFPISTADALFNGVYTYLVLGLENWQYLLSPLLYALILYVLLFLLCFKKPFSFVQRLARSKRFDIFNDNQREIVGDFFAGFLKISFTLLTVVCFLMVTFLSSERGKKSAEKAHQMLASGIQESKEFTETSVVYRDEQEQVTRITGYHIASSPALYAICNREGVQVIPFSRIISVQIPKGRSAGQN